jgi:hypothetical protein
MNESAANLAIYMKNRMRYTRGTANAVQGEGSASIGRL